MEKNVISLLKELRAYALQKGLQAAIFYHEEDSYLMRFANSAISLNTNEHLIRLEINVYEDKKRATYSMIADPEKLESIKKGIDTAAEMVRHAQPLTYTPTLPCYERDVIDMQAFDPFLASLTNADRLAYFNQVARGLESDDVKLSGIFSNGITTTAQISTTSEHTQYFACTDAQIEVVLAHQQLKWEVNAQQSAQAKVDLAPERLHNDLALMLHHYQHDQALQLPLGKYTVVFGPAAIGDVLDMLAMVGPNGGMLKRGYSFLSEEKLGQSVFSTFFTLIDDPERRETFPISHDLMGLPRHKFPLFENGISKAFFWEQDDADEFGAQPTGHTVDHLNLTMAGGQQSMPGLEALLAMPRDEDILYIPYLHYMNIVNPSAGMITGSSRFGNLLLKKDGSVQVPYNVRITQTFEDLFGENVEWLAREQTVHNTSNSY
ncbi:MAG TPA: metallopeptidase TldD-related protein, partial [Anaerolineaceae bacterium]|nr:metallopeptidase TldD-related protein [Anaerolineaceae bacterium]